MLKKNTVFILLTGLILTSCEEEVSTTPAPVLSLSSSFSSITVGDSTTLSIELADMEISVSGVSMQISYDTSVVEVDIDTTRKGTYFGNNAIFLFETVNDTVHFSIFEIEGDNMVSGTGKICEFEIIGLNVGSSTFTIVSEELYFIDKNGNEIVNTDLEIRDLTITVSP